MMIPTDDPWASLTTPEKMEAINARRVDHALRWGFFWAKNLNGECLLVLRHVSESSPATPLPRLKGVEISVTTDGQRDPLLILRLLDSKQRDIFRALCMDIVSSAGSARTEAEAVATTLRRTWRWHLLLQGGAGEGLSPDRQKGLIGELIVLERLILPHLPPASAVSTWTGPTGAPKDFEIGRIAIESKARRGAATPYVTISSEHQLDAAGVDQLFLHVVDLTREQAPEKPARTLTEFADGCRSAIAARDAVAVELFEGLLAASGFDWDDAYSIRWVEGQHRLFSVTAGFPRITGVMCPPGVTSVTYAIDLISCDSFKVPVSDLSDQFVGGEDAG